jgi:hypothetical protein
VLVNRIFGWGLVLGGTSLVAQVVVALFQGRAMNDVWIACALGITFVLVGVLYLRAPLSRSEPARGSGDRG